MKKRFVIFIFAIFAMFSFAIPLTLTASAATETIASFSILQSDFEAPTMGEDMYRDSSLFVNNSPSEFSICRVGWKTEGGVSTTVEECTERFAANTVYILRIELRSNSGYSFDETKKDDYKFNGMAPSTVDTMLTMIGDSARPNFYCEYTFEATENTVTSFEIFDVTKPIAGEQADYTFNYVATPTAHKGTVSHTWLKWAETDTKPTSIDDIWEADLYGKAEDGLTFSKNKYYTAIVELSMSGETLNPSATATINGNDADYSELYTEASANSYLFYYVFDTVVVESFEITDVVEPVAGEEAQFTYNVTVTPNEITATPDRLIWTEFYDMPESMEEIDDAEWYEKDVNPLTFKKGMYYAVIVEFSVPLKNSNGEATATINGQASEYQDTISDEGYDVMWYYYYRIFHIPEEIIPSVSITGVSEPIVGMKPDFFSYTVPENVEKCGSVYWHISDTMPTAGDWGTLYEFDSDDIPVVEPGKYYTADIFVAAEDGYTFAAYATGMINGGTAITDAGSTPSDNLTLYRTFYVAPDAVAPEINLIEKIEITGVTRPIAGENPSFDFTLNTANISLMEKSWLETDDMPTGLVDLMSEGYPMEPDDYFADGEYYTFAISATVVGANKIDGTTKATVNGQEAEIVTGLSDLGAPENGLFVYITYYVPEEHTCAFTAEVAADDYLSTVATCEKKAVYFKSCVECGAKGTETFESGEKDTSNHTKTTFVYTPNDDGATHTKKNECCGTVIVADEAHTYGDDGKCVCGAEKSANTPVVPEQPNPSDNTQQPEKDGLSGGAIAGIVIGSVVVAGVGGFAIVWFVVKKKSWADFLALFKKNNTQGS